MKTSLLRIIALIVVAQGLCTVSHLHAQGTAFTYQGRLTDNGSPANGNYDLMFTLFGVNSGGSALAGPLTNMSRRNCRRFFHGS